MSESQAIGVEPGGVLADRVRQFRLACGQSRLPGYLPHRAAVHLELCCQRPYWHSRDAYPASSSARLETFKRI